MRSGTLLFILFLALPLFASTSEDSLTAHIVNRLLLHVRQRLPGAAPPVLHPAKGEGLFPRLRGDTLFIPDGLWGYSASNDYRLPFYAGLLLFQTAVLSREKAPLTPEAFYRASVEAYGLSLEYIHTLEQDPLLDDLIAYHYLLLPYRSAGPPVLVGRDYPADSLRFRCMQRCILGFRCDSTKAREWIHGQLTASARLVSCVQRPLGWRKGFSLEIGLRNDGEMAVPVDLKLFLSSGDTLLRLPAFPADTVIPVKVRKSLLSAELDPFHRLFDMDELDHRFVSREYVQKHRARLVLASLFWDLFSLFSAFALLVLIGIFVQPLTRLFFKKTGTWYAACILLGLFIKFLLPSILFGFTLYGFVYDITYLLVQTSRLWIALSLVATARLLYYIHEKDGTPMNRLDSVAKYRDESGGVQTRDRSVPGRCYQALGAT